MNKDQFIKALDIISKFHTTKMVINKPIDDFVGDLGTSRFTIHITHCCPAVINELKARGYYLSMDEGYLNVNIY